MIIKEPDEFRVANAMEKAGMEAEKQMAFYLRRSFASDANIYIANSVRIDIDGDVAQIDHLVIHPYGLIIVESKSVTTTVGVNSYMEWYREYNGTKKGMASPIQQAKRQGEFLIGLLNSSAARLMDTSQTREARLSILVAISDHGIIERAPGLDIPQVCKADQVTDRIKAIVNRRIAEDKLAHALKKDELTRIGHFIIALHKPLIKGYSTPAQTTVAVAETSPVYGSKTTPEKAPSVNIPFCKYCNSFDLKLTNGKFGFYYICNDCKKNTAIVVNCRKCNQKAKIVKDGDNYDAVCPGCGYKENYCTEPPTKTDIIPVAAPIKQPEVQPANTVIPSDSHLCRKCGSEKLTILYGKFGYYFKCSACTENMPIKSSCEKCNSPAKLKKEGNKFTAICTTCNYSWHYHTNEISAS
ncbi:MAG: NERD domain-containing protein [bacterium]